MALISCGKEITAPGSAITRFARGLSFIAEFPTAYQVAGNANLVPFTKVHIVLLHADGKVALDTMVTWPDGANELTLNLTVALAASAPASGETMSATLAYQNAQGETVFQGGPINVTVTPSSNTSSPPAPVQVPVHYTGAGSNAASVAVSPKTTSGLAGSTVTISAQALNGGGQPIPGTPMVFSSSNTAVASVANAASGIVTLVARGQAYVRAQTLTGQADSALVSVTLPAARLTLVSGGGQTGDAGTSLPQAITARVTASDGIAVAGVPVSFSAASGSVSPTSAVSGADGSVSATWTLGAAVGAQTMTISSSGLSGSPITVQATARQAPPAALQVTAQPHGAAAGGSIGSVSVRTVDAFGVATPAFSGDVSVSLAGGTSGASLGGATTVAAVSGVATFSGLTVNRAGTGYSLRFAASGLTGVSSASFDVTPGTATKIVIAALPSSVDAGVPFRSGVVVSALDDAGNVVPTFTGDVSVSLSTNPGGGTLSGTKTRTAVAGVATFNDLSINRPGVGYVLTAAAGSLPSVVSNSFTVTRGAPATITVVSGGGQSGTVSTALPTAIKVKVADIAGNGIPSASIAFAVTGGGGSVAPTTVTADTGGVASATWTLGTTVGAQALKVTSGSLAATVTATGTAPVTNHLVITTDPGAFTRNAGAPFPTFVVEAFDGANVAVGGGYGISAGLVSPPAGAYLLGTTGIGGSGPRTFSTLYMTTAGSYTLTFTSPGMTAATSSSFTIIPGNGLAYADSGNGQAANIGSALANPFVVRFADSYGNPLVGSTVNWTVTAGGGAMSAATSLTDANGRARSTLTLGGTPGTNTVVASITGNGNTATFSATGNAVTGYRVWTGATSTDWFTASNWSPAIVPGATDSVQISASSNNPVIGASSPVTVKHLQIFSGGDLRTSSAVTIKGNLTSNGKFVLRASGALVLAGAPFGNIAGVIDDSTGTTNAISMNNGLGGCAEVLSGNFSTNGDVLLAGYCSLDTWGSTLTVGRDFTLQGTNPTLWMARNASDSLYIGRNFTSVQSSNAYGNVTTGTIVVNGNVWANGNIGASGTNRMVFAGSAVQYVTQTAGTVGLYSPVVANASGLNIPDGSVLNGTIDLTGGPLTTWNQSQTSNGYLTIQGTLHDPGAKLSVASPSFRGTTPIDAATHDLYVTTVTFDGTSQPYATQAGALTVHGNMQTYQYYTVNGNTLVVTGNLTVLPYAKFNMTSALDSVDVTGTVTFQGIISSLTNGKLVVRGNYSQQNGTSLASYQASAAHTTIFTGSAAQSVSFASPDTTASASCTYSCFGTLVVSKSGGSMTFNGQFKTAGAFTISNATTVNFTGTSASPRMIAIGNVTLPASYTFHVSSIMLGGNNNYGAAGLADTVSFVGSATQNLDAGAYTMVKVGGTPTPAGNFSTSGDLVVQTGGTLWPNGHTVTVGGTLSTVGTGVIKETGAADKIVASAASFAGGSTVGLLTNGELEVDGNFSQLNTSSTTSYAATLPHKTSFGGSTALTIQFAAPATSYFGDLDFKQNGGGTTFASDIYAFGTLNHSGSFGQNLYSSGSTRLLYVEGLNQTGAYPLIFNSVMLKFVDGTSNATFDNATFTNFSPSPSGSRWFEVFRNSAGTYTFSSLTFTGALTTGGRYIWNTGTQPVTLVNPSPACGGSCANVFYTGNVTWP